MSETEYQQKYLAALDAIRSKNDERGQPYRVGKPYGVRGGFRVCTVNDLPHMGDDIFRLAWGVKTANQIMNDREQRQGTSGS